MGYNIFNIEKKYIIIHKKESFIYCDYIGITMIEVETKVRKWGRSFGVVIPKEKIREEGIKENETIKLLIAKRTNVLKETFGTLKFKKSTDEMMRDIDRGLWGED